MIEWIPIDKNNIPKGEVLAKTNAGSLLSGYIKLTPKGFICDDLEGSALLKVTHYIKTEDLLNVSEKKILVVPLQKENIDWHPLKQTCQTYIDFISGPEYHEDNDFKQYIFESAIETIFGKDVWKYINEKCK